MYATREALISRFGSEIAELELNFDNPQDATNLAIQDAVEEIDGYLAARYTLPLPNVPNNLARIACDIARYKLYTRAPTEAATKRYDEAIAFLKGIRDRKNDLAILDASKNVTDEKPKNRPSTMPIGTTYKGGTFSDSTLDMMPSIHTHRRHW
ncbi:gp436 family protein [Acinetobacter sp. ANC 4640]